MQKETKKRLFFIVLSVCLVLLLYNTLSFFVDAINDSEEVNGIYIGREILHCAYDKKFINYRKLVRKAIKGNARAIRKIALIDCESSASSFIFNGSVLIDIIEIIGEERFIHIVRNMNKNQKILLRAGIFGGMDIQEHLKGKKFKEVFPKIYAFVHE